MSVDPPEQPLPRTDAEASIDASPSGIATTAARALVLGASLTAPELLDGLDDELPRIGIERLPSHWGGWDQREAVVRDSDEVLGRYGALDDVREREEFASTPATGDQDETPERDARVELWRELSAEPAPDAAVAWLRLLMTDREPVAAAAASAALSAWRRRKDVPVPQALERAREFTFRFAASDTTLARQISLAALSPAVEGDVRVPRYPERFDGGPSGRTVSTIVHGTNAWAGDWWFPGGDFHTYVRDNVRPDLFCGRQAFSWSGAYRGRHRRVAAERLAGWTEDTVGGRLHTLFAHSYGGVIALHATTFGLETDEIVLLSVPVENVPVEWRNIGRAISLRIHMDVILLAARRRQRFTENVDEHHLPLWFWHHGDSHDPNVWRSHDCAIGLGL